MMATKWEKWLFKQKGIYPLVTFRILFGLLAAISIVRFWYNGWIEEQYILPKFHFYFSNIGEVPYPSDNLIYVFFALLFVSAICISLGLFYRIATITFFCLFTYIELLDATYYLNHYYFVSLIAFLLIFIPGHKAISLDTLIFRFPKTYSSSAWHIYILQFQIGVVYFFAGLAKLQSDWMFSALPMKIWLPVHASMPVIGQLFTYSYTAYLFSWLGAIFDLSVVFFLLYRKTRIPAYIAVIVFHLVTWLLFPIGMFPFFMIGSTLIFFSNKWHRKWYLKSPSIITETANALPKRNVPFLTGFLLLFYLSIQVVLPLRHYAYEGNTQWTENGYRFAWRVMLMEKAGYAQFKIKSKETGRETLVNSAGWLTPNQIKMMSTQPDFILQFAHFLKAKYNLTAGTAAAEEIAITAEVYVSLNGRPSQAYIDNQADLSTITFNTKRSEWLLPLE